MKRALLLAVVVLALGAPEAGAHTTIVSPNPTYQQWVDEAKVPTPDTSIEVVVDDTGCLGGLACTTGSDQIEIVDFAEAGTFLHEIGHVFDAMYLTDPLRARFIGMTGRPALRWWTGEDDMAGEWFADAYEHCAHVRHIASRWGYTVGSELLAGWRLRKACWLIRYAY